jgi:hypothetical protein
MKVSPLTIVDQSIRRFWGDQLIEDSRQFNPKRVPANEKMVEVLRESNLKYRVAKPIDQV